MASRATSWADPLVRKLKQYPVLDREEELRLALLYRETHSPEIERRLVEGHLRLVVKIARSCCFRPSTFPDMVQEGVLGLMRAVRKYDPTRGVRLSTYAAWWIRAYLYQYSMVNTRVVRLVTTLPQRRLFYALRREYSRLDAHGEQLEPSLVARRLGVPVGDVIEMEARLGAKDVPLDAGGSDDEPKRELKDGQAGPDEMVLSRDLQQAVRKRMQGFEAGLSERDRVIFEQRLIADDPVTLHEVGRKFGISRERVRQLEIRLKRSLRAHLSSVVSPPDGQESSDASEASAAKRLIAA